MSSLISNSTLFDHKNEKSRVTQANPNERARCFLWRAKMFDGEVTERERERERESGWFIEYAVEWTNEHKVRP